MHVKDIVVPRPPFLGGGSWTLKELTPITILFGKNGSGKSLLLRGWRDSQVEDTHYVTPERAGALQFDAGQIARQQDPSQRSEQTRQNLAPNYRQQAISRITTYFSARGSVRDKDKLTGDPGNLERMLGVLMPDFVVSLSGLTTPPFSLMRQESSELVSQVEQLSSGEAQILTLGLDILTIAALWDVLKQDSRILLLDEPDAHLHPDLQVRLAEFVVGVAAEYKLQVVVATHSPAFLSALGQFGTGTTSVIYLDRIRATFTARRFDDIERELASCLGGHLLMGPLFGAPLLLVEGDDDYRIWSQVPRHHQVNIAVIPCNGEEIFKYQRTLEKILGSLLPAREQAVGYALLDGDKPLPTISPTAQQSFVRFVRLVCRESENLFLSDEVLESLDTDWETAKAQIVSEAHHFGEKGQRLSQAKGWARREVDLKGIVEQVSAILDPKRVHWTIRVGKMIGRSRPVGQLAEFLGEGVVQALWGAPVTATSNEVLSEPEQKQR